MGIWEDLAAMKGPFVAWASIPGYVSEGDLPEGHPGVIVDRSPRHLDVLWIGHEYEPVSQGAVYDATNTRQLDVRTFCERVLELDLRSGDRRWTDQRPTVRRRLPAAAVDVGGHPLVKRVPFEPLASPFVEWVGAPTAADQVRDDALPVGHPGVVVGRTGSMLEVRWIGHEDEPVSRSAVYNAGDIPEIEVVTFAERVLASRPSRD